MPVNVKGSGCGGLHLETLTLQWYLLFWCWGPLAVDSILSCAAIVAAHSSKGGLLERKNNRTKQKNLKPQKSKTKQKHTHKKETNQTNQTANKQTNTKPKTKTTTTINPEGYGKDSQNFIQDSFQLGGCAN